MRRRFDFATRRRALVELLGDEVGPEAAGEGAAAADRFARELAAYGELVVGDRTGAGGFLVRGEGEDFTERAAALLEAWDIPPAGRAHHRRLAERFEHKKAFFKMEWHRSEGRARERRAAIYYRRRPPVGETLAALERAGLPAEAAREVREAAEVLGKETAHFVAAALRPGREILHKLYFSQWVTASSRPRVEARLDQLLERRGVGAEARARWRDVHRRLFEDRDEDTLFVSFCAPCPEGERLQMKIDYARVPPELGSRFVPGERARISRRMSAAAERAGLSRVSYLGVRLLPGAEPKLKYYADFP